MFVLSVAEKPFRRGLLSLKSDFFVFSRIEHGASITRLPSVCQVFLQNHIKFFLNVLSAYVRPDLSHSQFNDLTGLVKPSIVRAIKYLEQMKLINKSANGTITTYCFNKDYTHWKPLAKVLTVSKSANYRLQNCKSALAKVLPTKETITKDNCYTK